MNFNEWFLSLPEGRQAALRDEKWILAEAAYNAAHDEIEKLKAENERLKAQQKDVIARFDIASELCHDARAWEDTQYIDANATLFDWVFKEKTK